MHRSLVAPWAGVVRGREGILARVGRQPPEARERRPSPSTWSLVDVVEHLSLVDGGVGSALRKEPSPGRPRIVAPGRWWRFPVLRGVLLLGIRIRTPVDVIVPRRDTPWEGLVARWLEGHRALEQWLDGASTEILGDPRFKHPIAGWLTVRQALVFMGDHQRHHLAQIDRVERSAAGGR